MSGQKVYPGVTPPISLSFPTPAEVKLSDELEKVLRSYNLFESKEESEKREDVLGKLSLIVNDWVRSLSIKKGFSEQLAAEAAGAIFTFGSYRLGVHGSGADIDTLCVAPRHVERSDFFSSLLDILKGMPEVTELSPVPDAYVPVLKMKLDGIQMDLLFARLASSTVSGIADLLDTKLLHNLDEKSVLSLNGCRVTDQILSLVPNITNFRMALRFIRLWAKRRGVYSNVMGYLGGVSWALLTARICQLYPNAVASTLIAKFFKVFEGWKWPSPVMLCELQPEGTLGRKVWNPKVYPKDKQHLMPIITPAYPAMNSTYNVSYSTLDLLCSEFKRGSRIFQQYAESGASPSVAVWNQLLEKSDFFYRYKAYVQIDVTADSEEAHRKWDGFVESKLRFLVIYLEQTPNLKFAHPFPSSFTPPQPEQQPPPAEDNTPPTPIFASSYFMGLMLDIPRDGSGPKTIDLTPAVVEFQTQVKSWMLREASMEVRVRYTKRTDLPAFIFGDGERPKVKRKRKSLGATSQFLDMAPADEQPAGAAAVSAADSMSRKRTKSEEADSEPSKRVKSEDGLTASVASVPVEPKSAIAGAAPVAGNDASSPIVLDDGSSGGVPAVSVSLAAPGARASVLNDSKTMV